MKAFLDYIEEKLGDNDDYFQQEEILAGSQVLLCGLRSMIDVPRTLNNLSIAAQSWRPDRQERWSGLGEERPDNPQAVVEAILSGKLALIDLLSSECLILEPLPQSLNRAVQVPSSESVIQGSMASFIEDLDTNIGIIRKHFRSDRLKIKISELGTDRKTTLALLYLEGVAEHGFIRKLEERIRAGGAINLHSLQAVSRMLGFPKWSLIPKFKTTELPEETACVLELGKAVLLVDRMPFALSLPHLLWDAFTSSSDRHFTRPLMLVIRAIRLVGAFTTVILPALYVALVAVNPEVLRIQLALSVAQSREGVPYPAVLETLIMLILLELVQESSVRLPRSVGPTLTMVGGIILGQAVVSAKLVSNLLIIVLAATTIANSTVVGVQNGHLLRSLKYITVILAAIFGVMGICAGVVILFGILSRESSFGISYVRLPFAKDELHEE